MASKKSFSVKMMDEDPVPETDASKDFLNFLTDKVKERYWCEKHLSKALPKLRRSADSHYLKDALIGYSTSAQIHIERLEEIFELLGEPATGKKCEGMAGLVEEAYNNIDQTGKGSSLRNAGIVMAAQKIVRYQMSGYIALVQIAKTMGNDDIISLMEASIKDEEMMDDFFTTASEKTLLDADTFSKAAAPAQLRKNSATVYDSVNLDKKL